MKVTRPLILRTILLITMSILGVSCNDVAPQRSTISSKSLSKGPTTCPTGQEIITDADGYRTCQDVVPTRPNNAITFNPDFCACKDGKAVSFGNCSSYCASKGTSGAEYLFAKFTVTPDISLSGLKDVSGWCNTVISYDSKNPKCVVEAKDIDDNTIQAQVISYPTGNSIVADLSSLQYDKTYVLTLVETSSGARSKPAQIIKPSVDTPISMLGPLKNAPISQYSCIIRSFSQDTQTGDAYYESAYRVHFYYLPRLAPAAVNASNIFCHDIFKYGFADDPTYPRLENIPGIFNLWDSTDPRFYDNNGNGYEDIYDLVVQKTKNYGGNILPGTKFFVKFSWPGSPTLNSDAGNTATTSTTQPIGYYMAPWIDQANQYKSFCLNSSYYNSANPLFQAFRDIIGVDTEGLYVGEKDAETVYDSNGQILGTGVKDYILIRETDLKQVWFYLNNGVPTAPTDANVSNVAVYFHYPLNKASPFIKGSSQKLYRVKGGAELAGGNTSGTAPAGTGTSYPPHDRKIGCIPKF